ncbi:cupin domain-containing protein [Azospirillum sp. 11R-A]|uniref:cupin domain-containing protein n=1 Tax=Azospirillum sp. 11R-A TaxID=3111634 RepID=UPI003C25E671
MAGADPVCPTLRHEPKSEGSRCWPEATVKRSVENAEHYHWGDRCDGWVLSPSPDMMVIQERMPAGTVERRHVHGKARQFFYVLSGELTMELEGTRHLITAMSGIEIPPGSRHQARNDSGADVHFLVVSSPTTRGDRTDLDG